MIGAPEAFHFGRIHIQRKAAIRTYHPVARHFHVDRSRLHVGATTVHGCGCRVYYTQGTLGATATATATATRRGRRVGDHQLTADAYRHRAVRDLCACHGDKNRTQSPRGPFGGPEQRSLSGAFTEKRIEGAAAALTGLVFGIESGYVPFGTLMRAAPGLESNKTFQVASAIGKVIGGTAGMFSGGTLTIGGAVVTAGTGGLASPAGLPVAAVGVLQAANGLVAVQQGLASLAGMIRNGGSAAGGGSTTTGSGGSKMFGSQGTQMTSKTIWKGGDGMRIDVENPNPGQRPGQIHFQQGDAKYLYDPVSKSFAGAPRAVNDLLETSDVQNAIAKGLRFLGE